MRQLPPANRFTLQKYLRRKDQLPGSQRASIQRSTNQLSLWTFDEDDRRVESGVKNLVGRVKPVTFTMNGAGFTHLHGLEAVSDTNTKQYRVDFNCTNFGARDSDIATNLNFLYIKIQGPVFVDFEVNASLDR